MWSDSAKYLEIQLLFRAQKNPNRIHHTLVELSDIFVKVLFIIAMYFLLKNALLLGCDFSEDQLFFLKYLIYDLQF